MVCVKCGKEIENNAGFCPYCGTSVSANAETQNVSTENIAKSKLVVFTILGFLFAPISWIFALIFRKTKPQIASAFLGGIGLFFYSLLIFWEIFSLIYDKFGKENPFFIFLSCSIIVFCLFFGVVILISLFQKNNKNITPAAVSAAVKKPENEHETEGKQKPLAVPQSGIFTSINKNKITVWATIAVVLFLLLTVVPSIISGYISTNSIDGKYFAKYDNNGNIEYTISFPKDSGFIVIKNVAKNRYSFLGNDPAEILKTGYKFNIKTKEGKIITSNNGKEINFNFFVSNNNLILSAGKIEGDISLSPLWRLYAENVGGIYFETKPGKNKKILDGKHYSKNDNEKIVIYFDDGKMIIALYGALATHTVINADYEYNKATNQGIIKIVKNYLVTEVGFTISGDTLVLSDDPIFENLIFIEDNFSGTYTKEKK